MEGRENPKASSNAIEFEQPWPVASLDEICAISSGITKGRKPPNEPLIEVSYMAVANVQDGNLNLDLVKTIQASASEIERYRLLPGDLLLTEGGDPDKLGRGTTWKDEIIPCIHQNHIFRVRANSPLVDMSFLSRLVASPVGKAYFLSKAKQTTGIASINLTQLRSFPVPLAPLNEQRRIAAKLDTTLAAVDACRQRLDGVAAILKRFRQAVLAAATSGELTREWREERGKSLDDWAERSVGDVVTDIDAGLNVQCEERPPAVNERGLVKISAVTWGIYDEDQSKTLKSDQQVLERNRIRSGDFLISRANTIELVGSCVIVHETRRALYLSDKVLRLAMPEERKKWLLMCLRSDNGRRQIEKLSSGNQLSMRNLSQKNLLSIKILLPPMDELNQIEGLSNQLFTLADQLEARLTTARKVVDRLTPALLAKAFRGELVPQDPRDEPASVLLERIRAARQAEAGAGKSSRRGRPKAAANPATSPVVAAPVTPDRLATLLRECGALSERALLAASELDPASFQAQLAHERSLGTIGNVDDDGQALLEAVG